jgi:hypothetical protein
MNRSQNSGTSSSGEDGTLPVLVMMSALPVKMATLPVKMAALPIPEN